MKKIFMYIWSLWEFVFAKLNNIHTVGGDDSEIRIAIKRYRGKKIVLKDGTVLDKGDKFAELHLNNKVLTEITSSSSSPIAIGIIVLKRFKKSLKALKAYINENHDFDDVNVFMGYTLFNQGVEMLGFEVMDMKSPLERFIITHYESFLLGIFHPEGFKRLRNNKFTAKMVLITKKTINNRY
ncbi:MULTISPECIES: YkoP family protein [Thermoanaerobacterium]|uniref:YkoP-like domain-containing protein n=2 Tax=Thermoanaerobacterium TaxID=28895 RepID=W9EC52_9THEO|nr:MULTISPECIES: hypothetical protein [Thermoanaerobacterium]AFK86312.1 hypothetical protein Tsac_1301 [Thermoanaerobacterium saccharolyticum JW/SL-YS485]ETO37344.1 hypothetical protein V518_2412 [Thermoanaerobacterium aotearoense SCUT27]